MRVRIKGPGGTAALSFPEDATVGDLLSQIAEKTSLLSFEVKYGFPPKPLVLEEKTKLLNDLDVKLNGESLTVVSKDDSSANEGATSDKQTSNVSPSKGTKGSGAPSVSFAGMNSADSKQAHKPVSLQKKAMAGEVPEIPLPERGSTLGKSSQSKLK
jgi:ubiquitin thioesterase OTU1